MPKGIGYNHGYTFWESSKCSRQSGQNLVNLICVLVVCTIWFLRWSSHWMLIGPTLRLFNCLCSGASRVLTILWMSVRCSKIQAGIKNWESMCSVGIMLLCQVRRDDWLIIGSVRLLSSFRRKGDQIPKRLLFAQQDSYFCVNKVSSQSQTARHQGNKTMSLSIVLVFCSCEYYWIGLRIDWLLIGRYAPFDHVDGLGHYGSIFAFEVQYPVVSVICSLMYDLG
jgi:hypothetical protein